MKNLNALELAILERLFVKFPSIKLHIPLLKILSRENTGVGMFVNFSYSGVLQSVPDFEIVDGVISTNENIHIDSLKYGLGYEVDISAGRINFIEFITYSEEWDGDTAEFKLRE